MNSNDTSQYKNFEVLEEKGGWRLAKRPHPLEMQKKRMGIS
jgi:hypothetical protein